MFWKNKTILGIILAAIFSAGMLFAAPALAQEAGQEAMESFGQTAGFATDTDITTIIARLIRTILMFLGVIVVVLILYGGFVMMTAGGNADRVAKAKKIITNAVIGLVLIITSFAITQFIINSLMDATGAGIDGGGDIEASYVDGGGGSSSTFYLRSVNTECSESLQNLELQFVFNKTVEDSTVEDGILIAQNEGIAVEGTFDISGRTVTFEPSQICEEPYSEYFCFDAYTDYTIELDDSELESVSGKALSCSLEYPCSFEFTTGEGVDIDGPEVIMDAPEDGDSIYIGDDIELLQAETTDDTGVSTVYFYVVDDDEALYTSGTDLSTYGGLLGGEEPNFFFTDVAEEWDTDGYVTNEDYDIWAKGVDCAGNYDTASKIEVVLRAANCNNDILDADYETDVDCGGDVTSPYYCGACEGDACVDDGDCGAGQCVDGICVTTPKIETVSPGDGAAGNLITIGGEGFGDDFGSITFLATETGDEVTVEAYECDGEQQWAEDEVVVQVPDSLTADGPIMITTVDDDIERTDDDYGPSITDFDLNAIVRPGLCRLDPNEGQAYTVVDAYGIGLGASQGSSTLYFRNYEADTYQSWDDELVSVTVPNATAGNYRTSVYTGDFVCIDTLDDPTGQNCETDSDCDEESGESCATSWCSETLDYCTDDDDCEDGANGTCESIRVGSNEIKFSLTDTNSETTPIISSIDTGWKACNGGDNNGDSCADDDDCAGGGTCDDAPNWGPPEQYVTIYGANFGTAEGTIRLTSQDSEYVTLADSEFPDYCDGEYWHDTYITVKIPQVYTIIGDGNIEFTTHDLVVHRQDGEVSEAADLVVLDDDPGPSICDIDPAAGPVGTEVTVYGERFGNDTGEFIFYSEQDADLILSVWDDEEISDIPVPDDAVTGPVYVVSQEGYESNSFSFAVGNCNEDAELCAAGEECCANGTCSEAGCFESEEVAAHFAYRISTATIPLTPEVVVMCDLDEGVVSPSLWEGWTDPEETCLNANLTVTFNMVMNQTTLVTENMLVEKCVWTDEDEDPDADPNTEADECLEWEEVGGMVLGAYVTDYSLQWAPDAAFEQSTWYKATLNGYDEEGDPVDEAAAIESADDAKMDGDFDWEFKTSAASDFCDVGDINVSPATHAETEESAIVDYVGQLIAANDDCQILSCEGYTLTWVSDYYGAVIDVPSQGEGECWNEARAEEETPAGIPALIEATVDADANPSDDADLIIDFTDPEVTDYFPDCSTACINALPWVQFNTEMDWTTISTSSVTLYTCEDSLCSPNEVTPYDYVASVGEYVAGPDEDDVENRLGIVFMDTYEMAQNTWYRVVMDADAITSFYSVPLSLSGSNYGTSENQYYDDSFSWTFKTKDSEVSCSIDRVEVGPSLAEMDYVGEREEFAATGYGAPDDCDADGQALQGGSYTWEAWAATDDPNNYGLAADAEDEVVAIMLSEGSIELSNNLPDWCSSQCTNIGSAVAYGAAVCGDGTIDPDAEECDDGNLTNDDGCSSVCLFEGSDACEYLCVDSEVACVSDTDCAETCVDNECTISGDYCETDDGSECPYFAGTDCKMANDPCCGDGVVETDVEECDDSGSQSGDGCSAICLNEGSRYIGSTCGDGGAPDHDPAFGGEDCDDGNNENGDGCSAICLFEGGVSSDDGYSECGDGTRGAGEDCDDGNSTSGDGCSSVCLNEGTPQCVKVCSDSGINCSIDDDCDVDGGETCEYYNDECCGDSEQDLGEDCDGGEDGEDGCSDECLFEGSSAHYDVPSFCGDGDDEGTGEECDVDASMTLATGGYGVSQVTGGAVFEVVDGYAISTISVTAEEKEGIATLQLQCSCESDAMCNESGTLGCGASGCCFERPTVPVMYPADNTAGASDGHCRNTAIYAEFDQDMDISAFLNTEDTNGDGDISETEFDDRVYLELLQIDGADVDEATCPSAYTQLAYAKPAPTGTLARAWGWVKSFVLSIFGKEANAESAFGCYMDITFETADIDVGQRVYVRYSDLLEEFGTYQLVVLGDTNLSDGLHSGATSIYDVDVCSGTDCVDDSDTRAFYIGDEICSLDYVSVVDEGDVDAATYDSKSEEFFSRTEETHNFVAASFTYRDATGQYEEIAPIALLYDWAWVWSSSYDDTEDVAEDVVSLPDSETGDAIESLFEASGNDGDETVLGTAVITVDELFDPTTVESQVSGTLGVVALLCENPWPELADFPYVETNESTNFSFYYCRDAGEDGTDDDLPALGDVIDVTSLASANILQELIFKVEGTSDAIGVRVIPNTEYLSPDAWVSDQSFTGSFSATTVDGYQAVTSGNTLYVVAANENSGDLYSNMYIISHNEAADEDAEIIFEEILENWSFNANTDDITDVGLCAVNGSYITSESGSYASCDWDGDCFETCSTAYCSDLVCDGDDDDADCVSASDAGEICDTGSDCLSGACIQSCTVTGDECDNDADCPLGLAELAACDAEKDKLTRDMSRLTDITDTITIIDSYGSSNKHCSVTKDETCVSDSSCPGEESCIEGYPEVQSGTFVPAISNSVWSSWSAVLGNDLATAIATDPINEFYNCSEDGYDSASCWNGVTGTFVCPEKSLLYGYQGHGGEAYSLYAGLEYADAIWNNDIDTDAADDVTIYAEYSFDNTPTGALPDGFAAPAAFCDGNTWGDSVICGDGVQGAGEACELGDTETIDCTTDGGEAGTITVACEADCGAYQDEIDAEAALTECIAYECGNGVVEDGEICDDGASNGTYGNCGVLCDGPSEYYCGDGYLAGGESCDCGSTGLYDYSDTTACDDDSLSWACLGGGADWCDAANGQYNTDINVSCAYNCTSPGPACGDGETNGPEACDGDYETHAEGLCFDAETTCETNSDCEGLGFADETCGAGGSACPTEEICVGGDHEGYLCSEETCSDGGGTCSEFTYETFRFRTCDGNCEWPDWSSCVGGDQVCGNGELEGDEQCDDGNDSDNDYCLNSCILNVCGDDYVYSGVESCDNGENNGDQCEAEYGSTCNYCNELCQYKTKSGAYCGDEEVNGPEVCDGSSAKRCIDTETGEVLIGGYCDDAEDCENDEGIEYSCRIVGVCDGGTKNGDYCTGTVMVDYGGDTETCGLNNGTCIFPTCADDCGSQCPTAYQTTGLLGQVAGSEDYADTFSIYSYHNDEGESPDHATLFVPACNVGTRITASINNSDVQLPDIDIVFITDLSGSMKRSPNCTEADDGDCSDMSEPERRIDYVAEATQDAIEELFDSLDGVSDLRVGLVSYSGSTAVDDLGAEPDDGLGIESLSGEESSVLAVVAGYTDETGGGTPTETAVDAAVDILNTYSSDDILQIVILLSDGEPSSPTETQVQNVYNSIRTYSNEDIIFYSATISVNPVLQAYMEHMSDEECGGGSLSDLEDCTDGTYAFVATDADGVTEMYEAIVDSILNTTVTLSSNNVSTTDQVQIRESIELPFPEEFQCEAEEQTIPIRNTFYGTGAMEFSDFEFTYCPYED
jgi:cysteine-rich repeat protein